MIVESSTLQHPFKTLSTVQRHMMQSTSFGPGNRGQQVELNYGTINAEFHLPPERPETPPRPSATIPFSRDPDFVDRGDILDQIDRRCSDPAARVALVGLGGVGKSQLAIEFAHRIAAGQPDTWVFWLHAGTQARVEDGLRAIGNIVKLPGRNQPKANIPQLVYDWLSNERNGRWIMILDSADDHDVFYRPASDDKNKEWSVATYLPQSRNGSILVTLAISQAAAYIQARAPRSSPEKYLAEFRKNERKKSRLLQYDGGDLRRDGAASNAILTTWQISFNHIHSKWTSAAELLSLMSFFDRQGIPAWVLKPKRDGIQASDLDEFQDEESDDSDSVAGGGSDGNTDADDLDGEFEDDIAILRDYCLIAVNKAGDEFEMHGLVQLSMKKWLEASGQHEMFKQQCIERLAASFPTGEYESWEICGSLFAHAQVALGYRPSKKNAETWATLLHNGGWYAWSQGRYDVAQEMLGEAIKVRKKHLGKEDMATLASMSLFALVKKGLGEWEEAEKLEVQVMEMSKTKLGADHPDTLTSMANLASTYRNQGRWEEAEKLFLQLTETSKTKLGADHPDTLTSMANLAFTWKEQGHIQMP